MVGNPLIQPIKTGIVVGKAVVSPTVLDDLKLISKVTMISNKDFERYKHLYLSQQSYIWIHVENKILNEDIDYLHPNLILATTSTGTTHISNDVIQKLGRRFLSLKTEKRLLTEISSTAEFAWMLILMGASKVNAALADVKKGNWNRFNNSRELQMSSTKVGIIGFGRLGKMVAGYAKAFGCEVYIWDNNIVVRQEAVNLGFQVPDSLEQTLNISDVVSLHVNTIRDQKPIISMDIVRTFTKELVLVNTSRGSVVDEEAILWALKRDLLSAYLTDVLHFEDSKESLETSLLWQNSLLDNRIVITPHIGGASRDAMEKCELNIYNRLIRML
jgi:D-3-phosphoglycerate dehydrogenase